MRLLWTAITLGLLLCIPFALWGEQFMQWFTGEAAVTWIRGWGRWGWLAVIALLVGDLFLPIPATAVMSAAGYLYGFWIGGVISALGSMCAGLLGYTLCRALGRGVAVRLAGEKELAEHESRFQQTGPWLVAASRWFPLLPEVAACLAGITRMRVRIFVTALACGAVPMGFTYAAIGAAGRGNPSLALSLSIALPPLLWFVVRPLFWRKQPPAAAGAAIEIPRASSPSREAEGA